MTTPIAQGPVDVNVRGRSESFTEYQQRIGAPLTFFTQVACNAYAAAATRDDVTHYDAMRVALQAVENALMQHNAPNAK
jgi:hypothetical protein